MTAQNFEARPIEMAATASLVAAACALVQPPIANPSIRTQITNPFIRSRPVQNLLTLGDEPDFDPFAADYPPATVEEKKTCVRFSTTAGDCFVNVDRAYSPEGVDRFLELVSSGFFTDMVLYRCIPGFLIQFGCAADPAVQAQWQDARIPDEPNRATFRAGTLSFAGSGTDSRSCHLFVALRPNGLTLGKAAHEATLGHVQEVEVFEKVAQNFEANGYPDLGGLQGDLVQMGNEAAKDYPKLDRILSAEVIG